jgi:crotonobetainyl-CoA:carnitine CoA-transferase CaiB-like acyl-CoA transferase
LRGSPLKGTRVVDVTHFAAGPVATSLLADFGAEVIKVERPDGDPFRRTRTSSRVDVNPGFRAVNRNKKSISIDLRTAEGVDLVRRLVEGADVFVENMRPGAAKSLGLGVEDLLECNPGLIYCSIVGFRPGSRHSGMPSVDVIAQAMSGIVALTGMEDGDGVLVGTPLADYLGGIFAAMAVLLALLTGDREPGRHVEVSLLDGLLYVLGLRYAEMSVAGGASSPRGHGHTQSIPAGLFPAQDGQFAVAAMDRGGWLQFVEAIGRKDLAEDPRFASNHDRMANRSVLLSELSAHFSQRPREYWLRKLEATSLPYGPVNTLVDVMADSSLGAGIHLVEEDGEPVGAVVDPPFLFDGAPFETRTPPPALAEHSREILIGLGYSERDIDDLVGRGVVFLSD